MDVQNIVTLIALALLAVLLFSRMKSGCGI